MTSNPDSIYYPPSTFACGDDARCHADDHVYCTPDEDGATASTVEVVADLTMCTDCAHAIANGIDADDSDQRNHVLRMWEHTKTWVGTIVVESPQSEDFATAPCDTCDTHLAGARYNGVLLSR